MLGRGATVRDVRRPHGITTATPQPSGINGEVTAFDQVIVDAEGQSFGLGGERGSIGTAQQTSSHGATPDSRSSSQLVQMKRQARSRDDGRSAGSDHLLKARLRGHFSREVS